MISFGQEDINRIIIFHFNSAAYVLLKSKTWMNDNTFKFCLFNIYHFITEYVYICNRSFLVNFGLFCDKTKENCVKNLYKFKKEIYDIFLNTLFAISKGFVNCIKNYF
ncbi:hypothetical protein H311_02267 [Anncaliia algerae PRA109]|nr:hypothetical protein H311_02267 [Anncaliia algerae PRA109]